MAREVRRAIHSCLGQDAPWVEGRHAADELFEQCLQFHRGSSEGEAEGFGAAVEELDLKTAVADRSGLTDQLIHPLLHNRAVPVARSTKASGKIASNDPFCGDSDVSRSGTERKDRQNTCDIEISRARPLDIAFILQV